MGKMKAYDINPIFQLVIGLRPVLDHAFGTIWMRSQSVNALRSISLDAT